ncbi:NAD(P)H-hydrate dehydratase [Microbacterium horticulturae]|uniref:ADP-dependent (S)-NAD(P)H-hydrate dehydratase n=1 Tax=Microbacterium horticulturae TaxID=3028316 RepID=A0ABY8BZJ3_9MICO|nr:ADP/ATP-dependent (S)-NAD(P)H-hydrate dehydratase [Microbacterium sp. KACC 23027]WEG07833.1 NAD(P)H-hydrate dehydratase [Microbacterium sp. KACC 23027]
MGEPVTWTATDAAAHLHAPTAGDDKYSRGVVGVQTGSAQYPGAAVLGVEAAWRTGIGMVRYLGAAREPVMARRPETVTADGRVQAWLMGSGMDAAALPPAVADDLRAALAGTLPAVVDAGALELAVGAAAPVVVTPHAREHDVLRKALGLEPAGAGRVAAAHETAAALGGAVLLKGAETIVTTPSGWTARVDAGTPWLATAGTGDVLGGVLGAVVAGAQARAEAEGETLGADDLGPLAATAAWVHGRAGVIAALRAGAGMPGPITALDVALALPEAVAAASRH